MVKTLITKMNLRKNILSAAFVRAKCIYDYLWAGGYTRVTNIVLLFKRMRDERCWRFVLIVGRKVLYSLCAYRADREYRNISADRVYVGSVDRSSLNLWICTKRSFDQTDSQPVSTQLLIASNLVGRIARASKFLIVVWYYLSCLLSGDVFEHC